MNPRRKPRKKCPFCLRSRIVLKSGLFCGHDRDLRTCEGSMVSASDARSSFLAASIVEANDSKVRLRTAVARLALMRAQVRDLEKQIPGLTRRSNVARRELDARERKYEKECGS